MNGYLRKNDYFKDNNTNISSIKCSRCDDSSERVVTIYYLRIILKYSFYVLRMEEQDVQEFLPYLLEGLNEDR